MQYTVEVSKYTLQIKSKNNNSQAFNKVLKHNKICVSYRMLKEMPHSRVTLYMLRRIRMWQNRKWMRLHQLMIKKNYIFDE